MLQILIENLNAEIPLHKSKKKHNLELKKYFLPPRVITWSEGIVSSYKWRKADHFQKVKRIHVEFAELETDSRVSF